ncbi:MAG TPA: hypothetical protein VE482_10645 [Candidatus Eisenbacteria bacterium]|nr:hypothetical protein [Candidatus Eisenbacteria bacterium]
MKSQAALVRGVVVALLAPTTLAEPDFASQISFYVAGQVVHVHAACDAVGKQDQSGPAV